jgi:DNA polymerase elongation subunit (family B)
MSNPQTSEIIVPFYSQIEAASIFWLIQKTGEWGVSIETAFGDDYYYLRIYRNKKKDDSINRKIRSMEPIEYMGYVYDLTTDNHHFAAGIGNLIVHNTDSVFFTFNLENPKTGERISGKDALEITIEIAQDAAHLCTQWLKPPMELSYEKTLLPFILLSKKRYVGMLYETDPNKGKMKFMGLSLKRRDTCDYLKDVYGEILNILMKEQNISKAIAFLDASLEQLIQGKVSMDKLAITKSLRSDYKNPQQIAHKVLADRIGQRDPGNKPKPGDRIKFVYVVNRNPKALLGERIETFEYILAHKLPIDYTYYITNQLMKPLQQLFGLAITQIWETFGKKKLIPEFQREMDRLFEDSNRDLEIFNKKKEKYTTQRVKELLFDPFLTKLYNKQNKIQTIQSMFQKYTK